MLKRMGWSFILGFTMVGMTGCGGPPAEEPAEPMSQAEIDENQEVGVTTDDAN